MEDKNNLHAQPTDTANNNGNNNMNQPGTKTGQPANNSQDNTVDKADGYGSIGIEEVDMLLMEDEDALDVDNSMYMDATDTDSGIEVDFYADAGPDSSFDDTYTAAGAGVDADEYADALDTVDIFVAERDAMPNTDAADSDFAEKQDAGVSWSGQDPLDQGEDEGCGCSF